MVQDKKPWLNEPDYKRWRDGETQLQCLILRDSGRAPSLPRPISLRYCWMLMGYL